MRHKPSQGTGNEPSVLDLLSQRRVPAASATHWDGDIRNSIAIPNPLDARQTERYAAARRQPTYEELWANTPSGHKAWEAGGRARGQARRGGPRSPQGNKKFESKVKSTFNQQGGPTSPQIFVSGQDQSFEAHTLLNFVRSKGLVLDGLGSPSVPPTASLSTGQGAHPSTVQAESKAQKYHNPWLQGPQSAQSSEKVSSLPSPSTGPAAMVDQYSKPQFLTASHPAASMAEAAPSITVAQSAMFTQPPSQSFHGTCPCLLLVRASSSQESGSRLLFFMCGLGLALSRAAVTSLKKKRPQAFSLRVAPRPHFVFYTPVRL